MLSLFWQLWLLPFIIIIVMLYTGKKKKKKQTYKPSVSYCNDEIKERFQSSLLSWGVFLNLQSIQVVFFYYYTWLCGYIKWHSVNLYTWFNIYFWRNQKRDTKWQTLGSTIVNLFFIELRTTGGQIKLPNIGSEHHIRKKHCDAECKA